MRKESPTLAARYRELGEYPGAPVIFLLRLTGATYEELAETEAEMRNSGFKLGTFFGIDIYIDWSWLLIFLLISWNLGSGFGEIHPDWSTTLQWSMAVLAALLFFASVLAHEMAHSLVAQRQGLPVRRITLFLFGGVSNIEREPPSPKAEFLISIVGPLTSIALGIGFILISGVGLSSLSIPGDQPLQALSDLGPITTMLLWLGPINLLLGVFNLIPGFPLDGGRVLRSILWAGTGNLKRATRWASYAGQLVAWLMIGGGIAMIFGVQIPFFGTGFVSGLWLAFIGWFLHSASVSSYRQVVVRDILEDVPVGRMMRRDAPTVQPDISISNLVQYIMDSDDYAFPVVDGDELVGVVTLDDVRSVSKERWDEVPVRQAMTPRAQLETVDPTFDAADALQKITASDIRQLPVIEDGKLVGLLRRRDLVRWLQLHAESEI
ncbi:MAG: site-2 protease family protein [Anaerolineales bacterium]|nr:site-2 protease family protein [Anaerolineales bacterium]